jgi:hypothetical protein
MSKPEHNRTDYGPDYVAFEDGRLTGGFTTESKPGGAPLPLSRSERQ